MKQIVTISFLNISVPQYDNAMRSLPVPNSGAAINRIEVWVVNTQANTQDVRNIIAVTDLGEHPDYYVVKLAYKAIIEWTRDFSNI